MTWFDRLTGIPETSPDDVRAGLKVAGETLVCPGGTFGVGRFDLPTLADLRAQARTVAPSGAPTTLREVVANVQTLHADPAEAGALFQVASQFNLLEMVTPFMTPEMGVGRYETDRTQGPACAIAAGAGTIYRNYFVPVGGRIGQTADVQIDALADLGQALGNADGHLWTMRNGYAMATAGGLAEITTRLDAASEIERDALRALLRVGIMWGTQVTLWDCQHVVTQVYGSALPVAYSGHPASLWEPFARLVLEASYEATLWAAVLNARETGVGRVFLTLLGGGVFGNDVGWITDAIERALARVAGRGLDVAVVSYGASDPDVRDLVARVG